jgi:glycosyltransferase involved in cell wall biosynthesis
VRPLRIAFVVSSLVVAGGERQQLLLAEHLPQDRFEVEFIARTGPGPLDERAAAAGARIRFVGRLTSEQDSMVSRWTARAERTTGYVAAVRAGRFDIVDAWLYPSDVLAAYGRLLTRTPVILSGRRNIAERPPLGPMGGTIDRTAHRMFDGIVANSFAVADVAVRVHGADPRKVHVIRNGVEAAPSVEPQARARMRRRLGADDDQILIGCVGNYREMKGHAELVEAFDTLAAEDDRLRLVLVGEGPTRERIEHQVERLGLADRVRVHGREIDIAPVYAALDVVVQASSSEGLPNVLLEAAAAGRPIVATDAGGSKEVVLDGVTGLLVPVGDEAALVRGVRQVATDGQLRERLGSAAREHMLSTFGVDRFVSEWAAYYEQMAARVGVDRTRVAGWVPEDA